MCGQNDSLWLVETLVQERERRIIPCSFPLHLIDVSNREGFSYINTPACHYTCHPQILCAATSNSRSALQPKPVGGASWVSLSRLMKPKLSRYLCVRVLDLHVSVDGYVSV